MQKNDFEIVELGDARLKQIASPVTDAEFSKALEIAHVMRQWMDARGGVGIAAPQIGVGLQMMLIASRPNARYPDAPHMEPLLMINPQPSDYSQQQVALWEGCLSVPGLRGRVTRPDAVSVRYLNEKGEPQQMALTGFPARIFQHEYDHLIGKTFVDRVQSVSDLVSEKVYVQLMTQQSP